MGEWSSICGVSATTIQNIAYEFTNHGKKAVVSPYRGACQHTNGTLNPACVDACVGRALKYTRSFAGGGVGSAPQRFADPSLTNPSIRFV